MSKNIRNRGKAVGSLGCGNVVDVARLAEVARLVCMWAVTGERLMQRGGLDDALAGKGSSRWCSN